MEDVSLEKLQHLSPEELELYRMRHSLAHVLAQAVLSFYPDARLGFGPPIDTGLYYDFAFTTPVTTEELSKIEKKMQEIIRAKQEFTRVDLPIDDAITKLESMNQPFKVEFAKELQARGETSLSFYQNGPFLDMCEGPHVENTIRLPRAFKVDSIAGAYWRGSEKNPQLTRIYVLAFKEKDQLDAYLEKRKLALERDHRKLGKELDIFHIEDTIGRGLPIWLPRGTVIREQLEQFAKDMEFLAGYQRVATPHITKEELFYRSGHLPYYAEGMYPPMKLEDDDRQENYYLKPMNCPMHHMTYAARRHSYRELPLRFAEYGTVYRYEKSGQLTGLQRVRMLSMNDAHIYLMHDQIFEEIGRLLKLYDKMYRTLGFDDYTVRLSLHDPARKEKYHDDPEMWARAESMLAEALDSNGVSYFRALDEAAFYGPKIDFQFKNVWGKEETVSTIQLDFLAPLKFDLKYVGQDGKEHHCAVLHRAPLSTHERLVGFLLEKFGGVFPTWLSPVQVRLIPVNDEVLDYAQQLKDQLFQNFVRVEVDDSDASFGKKIRNGAIEKIPVLLILGNKEKEEGTVTVRRYQIKDQETLSFDSFMSQLLTEIKERHFMKHLSQS